MSVELVGLLGLTCNERAAAERKLSALSPAEKADLDAEIARLMPGLTPKLYDLDRTSVDALRLRWAATRVPDSVLIWEGAGTIRRCSSSEEARKASVSVSTLGARMAARRHERREGEAA